MTAPHADGAVMRIWSGRGTKEGIARYCDEHFPQQVLPRLRATGGFRGARLLVRDVDGQTEVVVATAWDSVEAVEAFAGPDLERAVVEPAVAELLESYDERVTLFTLALEAGRDG